MNKELRPAIFIDKDGTLVEDVPYNVDPENIRLLPGTEQGLEILCEQGYPIIIVSNQPGIALGLFSEDELEGSWRSLQAMLLKKDVPVKDFYYCPHFLKGTVSAYSVSCLCRKPASGLFYRAAADHGIDLSASWMIGDILDDIEAGKRAGLNTVMINSGHETEWQVSSARVPDFVTQNLFEAALMISQRPVSEAVYRDEFSEFLTSEGLAKNRNNGKLLS